MYAKGVLYTVVFPRSQRYLSVCSTNQEFIVVLVFLVVLPAKIKPKRLSEDSMATSESRFEMCWKQEQEHV